MKTPEQAPPTAGQLARPALALADTLPLPEAIHAMHTQAAHLVLVIDEHGGLAGLATLEDILEQLLGQIPDEYGDEGRDAIRSIGDGVVIVGAAAGLREIERVLDVRFRGGRFVPIGGLVYERAGSREVVCGTEVVGRLDRLVVDPDSGRVSHLGHSVWWWGVVVVRSKPLRAKTTGRAYLQPTRVRLRSERS